MKTEKNVIDKIADRANLEIGADDARAAVRKQHSVKRRKDEKGKVDKDYDWRPTFIKRFDENRTEYMDAIQNMVMLGEYPTKEYHPVIHHAVDKDREIYPQPFYPWSILFHTVKNVIEPIVERNLILDTSAGRIGKGQTLCEKRMRMFMRRYPEYKWFVKVDLRKFYPSLPHRVVMEALRRIIKDERFLDLIEKTMLDYHSDIIDVLREEVEKKKACKWRSIEPLPDWFYTCLRGITIGSCISQIIGNLVLSPIDHKFKEQYKCKVYHRHCDDITILARTKEEAYYYLNRMDYEMNQIGMCVKASSIIAPIEDEEDIINNGRTIDFCGYVYSRHNVRMRKRNKVRCAKALHRVKSRKRRQEILAAYYGIAKWGNCRNLWFTLTGKRMSFADHGIKTEVISRGKDGKRFFDCPELAQAQLAQDNMDIIIYDFEDGLTIKEKSNKCAVLFRFLSDKDDMRRKFITSSTRIIDKLNKARTMEQESGEKIFPQPTKVFEVRLKGGRYTYDIE